MVKKIITEIEDKSIDDEIRYNFYIAVFHILGRYVPERKRFNKRQPNKDTGIYSWNVYRANTVAVS